MKRAFILLLVIVSTDIFALPCPNGNGILYKGDSIDEVLRQCGEPFAKHTSTQTLYSQQSLSYYRAHRFDRGYSQINIYFRNDRVARITIDEHYPWPVCLSGFVAVGQVITFQRSCGDWVYDTLNTNLCGQLFGVTDSIQYVKSVCGVPAAQSNLEAYTVENTELTYGGNNPQTIIFQNGKLVDWK